MTIIDGSEVAKEIRIRVKKETKTLVEQYHVTPHLTVILIGNNPASESYVGGKERACEKTGIKSSVIRLEDTVSEQVVLDNIDKLNKDDSVHGILLQLPIPNHLNSAKIIDAISPEKDVDGFTSENVALLANGRPSLIPCTPKGIISLLDYYHIEIEGKQCTVLGRSQIVGKPIANLLLQRNGTVTICHSKTKNLQKVTSEADILVVAIGRPKMVDVSFVKENATIIDVGISKVEGLICGDVDFESVATKAAFLTPVPKGVGPMTIASLLENTLISYRKMMGETL